MLLLGTQAQRLFGISASTDAIDRTLREGMERRKIPCVAAMVATPDRILYSGAFGKRDSISGLDIQPDSIFQIASMTKAITSVAAMQLVERGKLKLDEPVAKLFPELIPPHLLEPAAMSGSVSCAAIAPCITSLCSWSCYAGFAT